MAGAHEGITLMIQGTGYFSSNSIMEDQVE